jgi:hypothetical protein
MGHKNVLAILFQKGTQIPKFHIFESYRICIFNPILMFFVVVEWIVLYRACDSMLAYIVSPSFTVSKINLIERD